MEEKADVPYGIGYNIFYTSPQGGGLLVTMLPMPNTSQVLSGDEQHYVGL